MLKANAYCILLGFRMVGSMMTGEPKVFCAVFQTVGIATEKQLGRGNGKELQTD